MSTLGLNDCEHRMEYIANSFWPDGSSNGMESNSETKTRARVRQLPTYDFTERFSFALCDSPELNCHLNLNSH